MKPPADASAVGLSGRLPRRALSLHAAGIDAADVDPLLILRSIAADASAPATARVAACRALMALPVETDAADDLNERALRWRDPNA